MKIAQKPRKILIVDDDTDTVGLLKLVLQRRGYLVNTATCWEEVTERLRSPETEKQGFDLIILDVMMPERSGFDVYNALLIAMHPMPPVIFLSAKSSMETMVQAQEIGAAKYLVKPTTPDKLIAAVESVLQKSSS